MSRVRSVQVLRRGVIAMWLAASLVGASSCLVIGLNRFADEASISFDDQLLGTWRDADDDVSVTIEKSDWQAYRVSYVHPIANGQLTAYLFKSGADSYLDLMPVRGQDPGVFTIVGHTLVRVERDGTTLRVSPMAYDWFRRALDEGRAMPELGLVRNERDQLVATTDSDRLRAWLKARPTESDPAFGPAATFLREPQEK